MINPRTLVDAGKPWTREKPFGLLAADCIQLVQATRPSQPRFRYCSGVKLAGTVHTALLALSPCVGVYAVVVGGREKQPHPPTQRG